jgi:hypothetical protein
MVIKPVIWVFSNPFENRGYIYQKLVLWRIFVLEAMMVVKLKDWPDNRWGEGYVYVPPSDNRPTWVKSQTKQTGVQNC